MAQGAIQLTDGNFEREALKSPVPVLVEFTGPNCPPCRLLAPIIEQLAASYAGRLRVAMLPIDDNPGTIRRFTILSVPTLLMLKGGKEVHRVTGFRSASQLTDLIRDKLGVEAP